MWGRGAWGPGVEAAVLFFFLFIILSFSISISFYFCFFFIFCLFLFLSFILFSLGEYLFPLNEIFH
jgi:hypothetical protein